MSDDRADTGGLSAAPSARYAHVDVRRLVGRATTGEGPSLT